MGLPSLELFSSATRQQLWRGDALGAAGGQVVATGHAALDAQLPGGGWPVGALVELLQAAPQAPLWPLLLPALAQAVAARGGPVVLVGAPYQPFGPALAAGGLPMEALLWVRSSPPAAGPPQGVGSEDTTFRAWGPRPPPGRPKAAQPPRGAARTLRSERGGRARRRAAPRRAQPPRGAARTRSAERGGQSLGLRAGAALRRRGRRAGLAAAGARVGELRRLQLAAAQHEALLFVFRPEAAADAASPARLRLRVAPCASDAGA